MECTKNEFFELLKYSNELKRNKKSWFEANSEISDKFLNIFVVIERNFHYSQKQEYIQLAKEFLDDQITAEDFSDNFMIIYERISDEFTKLQIQESVKLWDLLILNPDRSDLGELLSYIYGTSDSYSPDPEVNSFNIDEKELKDCAKKLLLELDKE